MCYPVQYIDELFGSLLPKKGKYQTIANNLPGQGVLLCQIDNKARITDILEHVAAFFRQKGHVVKTIPFGGDIKTLR